MNIALCCDADTAYLKEILSIFAEVTIFSGAFDRPPCVQLAYFSEKNTFDLVVVALNGASGLTDCQHIKARNKCLPILWITEQEDFIHASKRLFIEEFLVKPITEEEITKCVKRIFNI